MIHWKIKKNSLASLKCSMLILPSGSISIWAFTLQHLGPLWLKNKNLSNTKSHLKYVLGSQYTFQMCSKTHSKPLDRKSMTSPINLLPKLGDVVMAYRTKWNLPILTWASILLGFMLLGHQVVGSVIISSGIIIRKINLEYLSYWDCVISFFT